MNKRLNNPKLIPGKLYRIETNYQIIRTDDSSKKVDVLAVFLDYPEPKEIMREFDNFIFLDYEIANFLIGKDIVPVPTNIISIFITEVKV